MGFQRYDKYTKLLSMKIARSLFGHNCRYIDGFATNYSQRPTSVNHRRKAILFLRYSTMYINRGNSLNLFKQEKYLRSPKR